MPARTLIYSVAPTRVRDAWWRSTRLTGRVLGWVRGMKIRGDPAARRCQREPPSTAHRNDAQADADDRAGDAHHPVREAHRPADHDYGRPSERGNGVELGVEHRRDLGHENVASHSAADGGRDAEQHRRERREMEGEGFRCARHGEQPEAHRIEQQD